MEDNCYQISYRPSATIIVAADKKNGANINYEILLFERTTNTAFAPGHCVFPGGTFEEAADECQQWMDYFEEYGISPNQLDRLIVKEPKIKRSSPLLTSGKNFSRDISLRLTACRETFEEVGILIFRNHETLKKLSSAPNFGEDFDDVNFDRVGWQFAVHNDAKQFLNLCRSLHIVPDLWCLYEWSLWRTPFTAKKRYDTVFYFVSFLKMPALLLERNEVKRAMILLFERTTNTAFAPGHCVFPGGTFEEAADECQQWMDYFEEYGISPNQLDRLIVKEPKIKRSSPLLTSGKNFSRDISLRLTACRETFEEVGILIFRNHETLKKLSSAPNFGEDFDDVNFDRVGWQFAVHNDAKQFLNLCRSLHIVPDLWCLYEWSLWRTPFTAKKRYDTVFYFVSFLKMPALLLERNEVKRAMWKTPSEYLDLHKNQKIWLPPPQVYELSRLSKFTNLQNLTKYASDRSRQGTELLSPFYYKSSDALIGVLPGDDIYPSEQNNESSILNYTSNQLKCMARNLHRIVSFDMHETVIQKNISSSDCYLDNFVKCKL